MKDPFGSVVGVVVASLLYTVIGQGGDFLVDSSGSLHSFFFLLGKLTVLHLKTSAVLVDFCKYCRSLTRVSPCRKMTAFRRAGGLRLSSQLEYMDHGYVLHIVF